MQKTFGAQNFSGLLTLVPMIIKAVLVVIGIYEVVVQPERMPFIFLIPLGFGFCLGGL